MLFLNNALSPHYVYIESKLIWFFLFFFCFSSQSYISYQATEEDIYMWTLVILRLNLEFFFFWQEQCFSVFLNIYDKSLFLFIYFDSHFLRIDSWSHLESES